jgi:hypothetical protein
MTISRKLIMGALCALGIIALTSCKSYYFLMADEGSKKPTDRFKVTNAYYQSGQSIALTRGYYEIRPADSTLLYFEGEASAAEVGEVGVATLSVNQVARLFFTLPNRFGVGHHDVGGHGLAEIMRSMKYKSGENLFVCQKGGVTVDSLKGSKVFGRFRGTFVNTSNHSFYLEGAFKVNRK